MAPAQASKARKIAVGRYELASVFNGERCPPRIGHEVTFGLDLTAQPREDRPVSRPRRNAYGVRSPPKDLGKMQRMYVRSEKGHGGGWTLACDLSKVTLRDIYAALGSPSLLAMGNRTEKPECLIEQAVNVALGQTFGAAEALLLARFGQVTLAMLSADVHTRHMVRGKARRLENIHA